MAYYTWFTRKRIRGWRPKSPRLDSKGGKWSLLTSSRVAFVSPTGNRIRARSQPGNRFRSQGFSVQRKM